MDVDPKIGLQYNEMIQHILHECKEEKYSCPNNCSTKDSLDKEYSYDDV